MAGIFSVTLAISIVGIISVLTLKHIELITDRKVFRWVRPVLDRSLHRGLVWAEHHLPNTLEVHGKKVKIVFIALVHMVVIRGMRFFERKLESLLSTIRQKTRMPQGTGEASMFLRQVSDHKRALVREVSSESR